MNNSLLFYFFELFIQENDEEGSNGESQVKDALMIFHLLKDPYVVIATGSVWFSTSSMALLEPCLPLWLLETIHPKVRYFHPRYA